ncbi:MAG TPA: enterotoxin [Verrucomicrobiae bacterium]|nr:enterotoxin [Verrucomicrobiae bacterium]
MKRIKDTIQFLATAKRNIGKKHLAAIVFALAFSVTASTAGADQLGGSLANKSIAWNWEVSGGELQSVSVEDKLNGGTIALGGDCFQVVLGDGTVLKSSDLKLLAPPKVEALAAVKASPVAAMRDSGRQLVAEYSAPGRNLAIQWRVMLRRHSAYIRQELSLKSENGSILVKEITLFNQAIPGAKRMGTVDGSPVVAGNFFFGYEHPMAQNVVDSTSVVRCSFLRNAVLEEGETLNQSCVIGVAPAGQMRRGFLAYLERERAHPYRPFLHYNSWYDLRNYNQAQCVNAINEIGDELAVKRGVKISSFLFDDGWDDTRTLWKFHSGFPNGFTPLLEAAEKYHAGLGVWLSPFGGYGDVKQARMKFGSAEGFETNASGFSMAGPNYYRRFHDICAEMIRNYGVNEFKFDGLAAGAKANEAGLTRDGDAMLRLIGQLRAIEPHLFVNQTTGTWPSPFWLLSVDSTWRDGGDHDFYGKGSMRQRWITYRDMMTYRNVVLRAPLYPLNSIMVHGIIYGKEANGLTQTSDEDFADEVRDYFGLGTQLQELYVTPDLLDKQNWDDLAEAARWSRANANVLVDTHWIGGDPGRGEIYGWASWSPHKVILTLRNPDDRPAVFSADPAEVFELPASAKRVFRTRSPWLADHDNPDITIRAGEACSFKLAPFQLLVLESR